MQKSHANQKGKLTWLCKTSTIPQKQHPPTQTKNRTPQLKFKTGQKKPDEKGGAWGDRGERKERDTVCTAV